MATDNIVKASIPQIFIFLRYLFIFLITYGISNLHANCYPDSIRLNGTKEVVKYINNEVIKDLRNRDRDLGDLKYCLNKAIRIGKNIGYGKGLVKSYDLLGRIQRMEGDFDKAKNSILSGLLVADSIKSIVSQARMLNSLGNIESQRGNSESAIDYYLQAKRAWSIKGKKSEIIGIDINIAGLHLDQKNYDQASSIFKKAYIESKNEGFINLELLCCVNLGILLEDIGNFQESLIYYENIIDKKDKAPYPILHKALLSASVIHLKLGNNKIAEDYFSKSLPAKDETGKLELLMTWGDGLIFQNHYQEGIEKYLSAVDIAEGLNDIFSLSDLYEKISDAFKKQNDYKMAWTYFEKQQEIQDTLASREKRKALANIINSFEKREKEIKIAALEKQRESDKIIKLISGFLILMLLIVAISLYSRYKLKKESSEVLELKNETLSLQNQKIKSRELLLKKSKQEIEAKNKLLAENSEKITNQNKELQRYNMDLEQFAYSVSHDLKAPIRSINSFLYLINKNIDHPNQIKE